MTASALQALSLEVLKVGGSTLTGPTSLAELAGYVAERCADRQVVLVHGGGPLIDELHSALGLETSKPGGLRATGPASMKAVTMALRGAANAWLVGHLVARGVPALGLSGVDLGLLRSTFLNRERLGRVGGPPCVDRAGLLRLLDSGYVPVLAPVCLGPDGGLVNVNADTVAHSVAAALEADSLDFLSDVPGVYAGGAEPSERLRPADVNALLRASGAGGGMIPKLQASLAALREGVGRVRIGNLDSLRAGGATEVVA